MAEGPSPVDRIAASVKQLSAAAQTLNSASVALSKPVAALNVTLRDLNLRITAWERINGSDEDGYGNFWSHDVGYARIGRMWGLALRTRSGNHNSPEDGELDEWLFNDAPPSLQIDAVKQIPDLIDKLIKSAEKTARKLQEKATEAEALAAAMTSSISDVKREARDERQRKLRERQS